MKMNCKYNYQVQLHFARHTHTKQRLLTSLLNNHTYFQLFLSTAMWILMLLTATYGAGRALVICCLAIILVLLSKLPSAFPAAICQAGALQGRTPRGLLTSLLPEEVSTEKTSCLTEEVNKMIGYKEKAFITFHFCRYIRRVDPLHKIHCIHIFYSLCFYFKKRLVLTIGIVWYTRCPLSFKGNLIF